MVDHNLEIPRLVVLIVILQNNVYKIIPLGNKTIDRSTRLCRVYHVYYSYTGVLFLYTSVIFLLLQYQYSIINHVRPCLHCLSAKLLFLLSFNLYIYILCPFSAKMHLGSAAYIATKSTLIRSKIPVSRTRCKQAEGQRWALFFRTKEIFREMVVVQKKQTMDERNGSFREIKKNSFDRTGKYDHVFTESTNFAKDLKKYRFLRNEQFLEQTFKKRKFLLIYEKGLFFLLSERFY